MKIIGHRGARGLAPENTLASLGKALEHGVDMIEFDVRVTKDGVPILHHDADLRNPDGHKCSIARNTYGELKQHRKNLATLDEALGYINARTDVYIEVKPGVQVIPIIELLDNKYLDKSYPLSRISLGSKSQKTLRELHAALPDIQKIVIEPWSGVRARVRAKQVNTKVIAMNRLWLWSGFIKGTARSGYELYAYTLNDPRKAIRWQRHGLKGVVTDFPDLYRK